MSTHFNALADAAIERELQEFWPTFQPNVPYSNTNTPWHGVCLVCAQPISPRFKSRKIQGACGYCGRRRVDSAIVIGKALAVELEPLEPYTNALSPWKCKCLNPNCGAVVDPRFSDIRQFKGCGECKGQRISRTARHSRSAVLLAAASEAGYVLRNVEYRESSQGVEQAWILYTCDRGHENEMHAADFLGSPSRAGRRCPDCAAQDSSVRQRSQALEELHKYLQAKAEGYVVVSVEYRESGPAGEVLPFLQYECSEGHHDEMTVANFKKGKRCPKCATYGISRTKPTSLYVMTSEELIKVGVSNTENLDFRIDQHRKQAGMRDLVAVRHFATFAEAEQLEAQWKSYLDAYPDERYNKEWVLFDYRHLEWIRDHLLA